jgi:hypothetical protein
MSSTASQLWSLTVRALICKEWRENIKWVPLPGLVILLVFLIDKPDEPIFDVTGAFFCCLTAVVFAAALGFLQVFFEGHGDKRSLLLHRPLSPSRVFLAKTLAGIGLYLLALGIPFVCLESWMARPGNMPAPYHRQTSLPWLADIFSGLVYYFAGMLVAQRDVRWYGSRCLPLAAAFLCSFLVWTLPEFWQALVAIGIIGFFLSLAAWGSFGSGGAYPPQPGFAKAALALTFVAGLFTVSVFGKQLIGEGLDSGFFWDYSVDRKGREVAMAFVKGRGSMGPWIDLQGHELPDLNRGETGVVMATNRTMEEPLSWSYRNSGRYYVECRHNSKPAIERWFYDPAQGRLLGYDAYYRHFLGSFGPNGFAPAGAQPGEPFRGELRYENGRWGPGRFRLLAFPDHVYAVDIARRTIRSLFTPRPGDKVTWADVFWDHWTKWEAVVVSTDKSFHFLTREASPLVSFPRAHGPDGRLVDLGKLENPGRYYAWYAPCPQVLFLDPEQSKALPFDLHEYDANGREVAHQHDPQLPYPVASYAKAFFGLVTPMTEVATLVGLAQYLRSEGRSEHSNRQSVLLESLENTRYYIPGTSRLEETPSGLIPGYIALMVLSAAASALGCFLLARRYAFSGARHLSWALTGFFFGWVGLVLMLVLQDWPARVACPKCRKFRVVTANMCEHCGAPHLVPAPDGTEIFEKNVSIPQPALASR